MAARFPKCWLHSNWGAVRESRTCSPVHRKAAHRVHSPCCLPCRACVGRFYFQGRTWKAQPTPRRQRGERTGRKKQEWELQLLV